MFLRNRVVPAEADVKPEILNIEFPTSVWKATSDIDRWLLGKASYVWEYAEELLVECPSIHTFRFDIGIPITGSKFTAPIERAANMTGLYLELSSPWCLQGMEFPNLDQFGIVFRSPSEDFIPFMRNLKAPKLEYIHCGFWTMGHFEDTARDHVSRYALELPTRIFRDGICKSIYHANILEFNLELWTSHVKDHDAALSAERAFYDALVARPFPKAHELTLNTTKFCYFYEDLANSLPAAYPDLKTLHLQRPQRFEAYQGFVPGVQWVHCFVSKFKALHVLWLAFDLRIGPIDSVDVRATLSANPCSSLREWYVFDSESIPPQREYLTTYDRRMNAAKTLRAAFPHLEATYCWTQPLFDFGALGWAAINEYLEKHPKKERRQHRSLMHVIKDVFGDKSHDCSQLT